MKKDIFKIAISLTVATVLFSGCQNQPQQSVKKVEIKEKIKTKQEIEKERLEALKQKIVNSTNYEFNLKLIELGTLHEMKNFNYFSMFEIATHLSTIKRQERR